MKKLLVLTLCAVAVVGISSCNKTKKASAAALKNAELLRDGKYDLLVEEYHFAPEVTPEVKTAEKQVYHQAIQTKIHPVIQAKGGLKKSTVVSEKVSEDGKKATVVLNHEYGNGQLEQATYDYALADNNQWKLDKGNLREVWHTQTPEGQAVTIKLRENDHKDVLKENLADGERDRLKEINGDNRDVEKIIVDGDRDIEKQIDTKRRDVEKSVVNGERTIEKTITHKDGDVTTKEKVDGKRTVNKK